MLTSNLSDLIVTCSACGNGHSAGYQCASVRKAARNASFYPARTFAKTLIAKGTR